MKDVLVLVNIQLQHEPNLTWPTPAWGANSASDLLAFVAPAGRLHKGADRKVRPLAFRLAKRCHSAACIQYSARAGSDSQL
jgi:hypothetical protein